jgi:hypothetical protein
MPAPFATPKIAEVVNRLGVMLLRAVRLPRSVRFLLQADRRRTSGHQGNERGYKAEL